MQLSKSSLAIQLSLLKGFVAPKAREEQYCTDSEIAASVMWHAFMSGDIEGKTIADLGAGTGILGIAALLLGARKAYFVEKDSAAASVLRENLESIPGLNKKAEIIVGDISLYSQPVDLVVQNPPFGVQKIHSDIPFLEKAFKVAPLIFSFHKTETKDYLAALAGRNGFSLAAEMKFSFPLKQTMSYHKSAIKRVMVSCFVFRKSA